MQVDFSNIVKNIKFDDRGLVPCVAQDSESGEVLMLAYMNEESFRITLETGYATYFSRSRQKLWKKGETSGNTQKVVDIRIDCDGDTILLLVDQKGPACHTGEQSCFYRNIDENGDVNKFEDKQMNSSRVLEEEYTMVMDRVNNPKEGSYTNYLFREGIDKICKKIGEESSEIIIAAKNRNRDEVIYEVSDFMYHVTVLMAEQGVEWKDIFQEIIKRRK